jgi:hypothetical protein
MFKDISDFDQKRRNMQMNQAILKFALKKQGGGGDFMPPTTPYSQFQKEGSPLPFNRPMQPTPG